MVQFFFSLSFAYFFKSNLPIHITFTVLIMIQKKPILSKHFCQSPNLCSMHWQNTYRHGLWLHVPHVFWNNEFFIVCSYFSGFSQLPWGIFLYLELSMASRVPSHKRLKATEQTKGILLQKPPSTCDPWTPALTPCFGMAVNWGIIYFYFVSFTAGMTIPTSVQGMFCLGEKKKKKTGNRNYKGSKLFD